MIIIENLLLNTTKSPSLVLWGLSLTELLSIVASFGVIGTIITAIIALCKYRHDVNIQKKEDSRLIFENNKKEVDKKIEIFFGPCMAFREESKVLYSVFASGLKRASGNVRFRTLRYLCDANSAGLSISDSAILEQIMLISKKNLELIEKEGGVVSNPALNILLGKLCAHFRVLALAYEKKLIGKGGELEAIVFPLEIDGALYNEVRKLKASTFPKKINNALLSNVDYYNKNFDHYYNETINIDMNDIYAKFTNVIADSSVILDAGCGVGRDTINFIKMGYKVTSFDLSEKMVELCNKYPFAFCQQESFLNIDYYEEFDGVWANASLLHFEKNQFNSAIKNLVRSLKPNGVLFFSLKKVEYGKVDSTGRIFYYYDEQYIKNLLYIDCFVDEMTSWETTKKGGTDIFVHYLLKKK